MEIKFIDLFKSLVEQIKLWMDKKAEKQHNHAPSEIQTDEFNQFISEVGKAKVDKVIIDGLGDSVLHNDGLYKVIEPEVDDTVSATDSTYSSNKIDTMIGNKADKSHTHNLLHEHANKTALDGISTEKVADWTIKTSKIVTTGLGDKYLSDDGVYKTIEILAVDNLINDVNLASTTTTLSASKIESEVASSVANKVDKVANMGLSVNSYSNLEKSKLAGISDNANNYVHPYNSTIRHVTDDEKTAWYAKASTSYVDTKVATIVNSAPATLDTLNELAKSLGNDPNFATTIATQIGSKVDKIAGKGLSTNDYTSEEKVKVEVIDILGNGDLYLSDDGTYKAVVSGVGTEIDDVTSSVETTYSSSKIETRLTEINSTASDIAVLDTGNVFISQPKNVESILNELFIYASDGKSLIATAITGKGVDALPSENFGILADKIGLIESGTDSMSRITKLNISAPYVRDIVLTNDRTIDDICTSVMEYIADTGIVKYNCGFDNADSSSFNTNEKVIFDGTMHCKNVFSESTTSNLLGNGKLYESADITLADFNEITIITSSGDYSVVDITATPTAQLVIASNNINLTGISTLDSIVWDSYANGTGVILLLMSFNSGITWYSYKDDVWVAVDITDLGIVEANAMSKSVTDTLDTTILENLRNGSNELKFAYFLKQPLVSDIVNTNQISISVSMQGYNQIADQSKYTYTYNTTTKTISYEFTTDGTYTINYID